MKIIDKERLRNLISDEITRAKRSKTMLNFEKNKLAREKYDSYKDGLIFGLELVLIRLNQLDLSPNEVSTYLTEKELIKTNCIDCDIKIGEIMFEELDLPENENGEYLFEGEWLDGSSVWNYEIDSFLVNHERSEILCPKHIESN